MICKKTAIFNNRNILAATFLAFTFCSNPTKPNTKAITITSDPDVAYGVYVNGKLYQTPVELDVPVGNEVVVVAQDMVETATTDSVSGNDQRYVFLRWTDGVLQKTRSIKLTNDTLLQFEVQKECKVQTGTEPLTINAIIEGTNWYTNGDTARFLAPHVQGYEFNSWKINGSLSGSDETLSIKILEPSQVVAVYRRQYVFSVATVEDSGLLVAIDTITFSLPTAKTFCSGTIVTVNIPTPQEKDVNALVAGADMRYTFISWNDFETANTRTIALDKDVSISPRMQIMCKLETETNPQGVATIQGTVWREKGSTVNFTAPAVSGYVFEKWEVNGVSAGIEGALSMVVDEPKKVTAIYSTAVPKQYSLSVETYPETALVIKVDTTLSFTPFYKKILSGTTLTVQVPTGQEKDQSSLISGTDVRFAFTTWSDMVTANPRSVIVTQDMTFIARMSMQYKVEMGIIPAGIGQVNGGGWYESGSSVNLIAPVLDKYNFDHWDVNGTKFWTQNTASLQINEPKKVVAVYNQGILITLKTTPDPSLSLIVDGTLDTAPVTVSRISGGSLTLSVSSPQEKDISANVSGTDVLYFFAKWNNGDTSSTRTMLVTNDTTVTAQFSRQFKVVTSCSPSGVVTVPGSGWYKEGDTATIIAPQVPKYKFDYWEINGISVGSKDTLAYLVDNPKSITAVYRSLYNLSLGTYPVNGLQVFLDGTVFLSPETQVFAAGSTVTVSAINLAETDNDSLVSGTDTRYTFMTWNDMVTANPRNVVIDKDISLTAQIGVKYKIETDVFPAGITTPGGSMWYDNGTSINMTAPAIAKYKFDHWEIGNAFYSSDSVISLAIDKPKKIVGRYKPVLNIALSSSPDTSIGVQVNGKSYTTPVTITLIDTSTITIQAPAQTAKDLNPLVTGDDAKYSFVGWGDGNTSNPRTVFINKDTTITAVMVAKYKVETATSPDSIGVITTDVVPDSAGYYARGTTVIFTAPYRQFYALDHWEVNGVNVGTTNSLGVLINRPEHVTPIFVYLLTINSPYPKAYYDSMTSSTFLPIAVGHNGIALPDSLVIPPGMYSFFSSTFNLSKEGLYRFAYGGSIAQRIVYKSNLDLLMSSIAWIACFADSGGDNNLSNEQLTQKAKTDKLSLVCSEVSRWGTYLCSINNLDARMVYGINIDQNNHSGHVMLEAYNHNYQKWVLYDLRNAAIPLYNQTPLSELEFVNIVKKNENYNLQIIANGVYDNSSTAGNQVPIIDEQLRSDSVLKVYYREIMQVALIREAPWWGNYYFCDSINQLVIQHYALGAPPGFFVYVDSAQFVSRFYSAPLL
jgi:hypothetical protein